MSSTKKTIISLDIARGIAAVLVFASHLRAFMFLDFKQLSENKGIVAKCFYFLTAIGHESVMIFFVLSGFLVAGSVYKSYQRSNFSWKSYLVNRITRLHVVFIPALILTLFWDKIGIYLTHSDYYAGVFKDLAVALHSPVDHSGGTFVQSLLFLQTITAPVFGTNGASWSLANEFWYYIVFPISFFIIPQLRKKQVLIPVVSLVLLGCFFTFFPADIIFGFGIWLLGFLAYILTLKLKFISFMNSIWVRAIALLLLILSIVFSVSSDGANLLVKDYAIGITYFFTLLSFLNFEVGEGLSKKVIEFFSNISYTLYLVHMPVMVFISCYFFNNERFEFNFNAVLIFLVCFISIIIYAYLIYILFEKRTPIVRDWVLNKLSGKVKNT